MNEKVRGLAIDRDGGGDDASVGIDLEEVVWVAGQAVGDGVVGRIQVEAAGGDANCCADSNVFIDLIRCRIAVGWRGDVELIEIIDRDVKSLGRRGTVAGLAWTVIERFWPCLSIDRDGGGDDSVLGSI